MSPASGSRFPSLDGLRGVAILLVVTHNLNVVTDPSGVGAHLMATLLEHGWIGVQLFFVLSGFLITGILMDSRDAPHHYLAFFGARVFRILPLYYLTLFIVFVLLPAVGHALGGSHSMIWPLALFVSNWTQAFQPGESPLPHFWSLAVEEQFYLVWPFLVRRLSAGGVVKLCLALTGVALIARLALIQFHWPSAAVYEFSVCRMDALACGAAAAALLRMPASRAWLLARPLALTGAALGVLVTGAVLTQGYPQYATSTQTLGYLTLALAFALLVLGAVGADLSVVPARWAGVLRLAWLRRIGWYSYAMYVVHVPLHAALGMPVLKALGWYDSSALGVGLAYDLVGTVAVVAIGALSFHAFESHFLRWKTRFTESLAKSARGTAVVAS
jgi:peptidoglycan/LPS O-acetylase OafA/YrhL